MYVISMIRVFLLYITFLGGISVYDVNTLKVNDTYKVKVDGSDPVSAIAVSWCGSYFVAGIKNAAAVLATDGLIENDSNLCFCTSK